MKKIAFGNSLAVGMAIFSMFFGAGNITFPIFIGTVAKDLSSFAIAGFVLTAVLIPFFGLIVMSRFEGDYWSFFKRLGVIPAWCIVGVIMLLVGPFGALPRCVVIAHSTLFSVFST